MSWYNIASFSFLLLVFAVIPSTMTTIIFGVPENYTWLRFWGEHLVFGLASIFVFFMLGRKGLPRPYLHAFFVLILSLIILKLIVSVLIERIEFTGLDIIAWFFALSGLLLGTYIGLAQIVRKDDSDTEQMVANDGDT